MYLRLVEELIEREINKETIRFFFPAFIKEEQSNIIRRDGHSTIYQIFRLNTCPILLISLIINNGFQLRNPRDFGVE